MQIAGIDHLVLRTTKIADMLDFYCNVLGCVVERETAPETGLTQLRAGNALIDLVAVDSRLGRMGGGAPTRTANNLDHFCLLLQPISEHDIKAHLSAHGIDAGKFEERYGSEGLGTSVYIQDPEGNTVELRSRRIAAATNGN